MAKMSFDFVNFELNEQAWEWFVSGENNSLHVLLDLIEAQPSLFTEIAG